MRSVRLALLAISFLIAFMTTSAHSQAASRNRAASPSSALRMAAVQNQIEKQQAEINTLRLRLATLQREYEDLADKVADQSSDPDDNDDDNDADDPDIFALRVHNIGRSSRSSVPFAGAASTVWTHQVKTNCRSRRVH